MGSFNKIIIVGYLGRDPELRYTPDGTPVCDFSVATTERKKDRSGEFQDVTTWFRVSLWRRQAEVASQYLSKGKQVYVEGRLSQREYQDKDGNTRTSLEVQGTDLQFLGQRGDEAGGGGGGFREERPASRPAAARPEPAEAITDDDIPF
jgi:single-strand DNA-binding protein